jgi:hypothetical protein
MVKGGRIAMAGLCLYRYGLGRALLPDQAQGGANRRKPFTEALHRLDDR